MPLQQAPLSARGPSVPEDLPAEVRCLGHLAANLRHQPQAREHLEDPRAVLPGRDQLQGTPVGPPHLRGREPVAGRLGRPQQHQQFALARIPIGAGRQSRQRAQGLPGQVDHFLAGEDARRGLRRPRAEGHGPLPVARRLEEHGQLAGPVRFPIRRPRQQRLRHPPGQLRPAGRLQRRVQGVLVQHVGEVVAHR
jgi:hypothetical protein